MSLEIEICIAVMFLGAMLAGILSLVLGVYSARLPKRSIEFYQGVMERFNWRVTPIDEDREIKNTRRFGLCLVILSLVTFVFLAFYLSQMPQLYDLFGLSTRG